MLKDKLLSKDFYLDHMSMFLKDSFGMIDREETYRAILNNVNDIADDLISRYDIYNQLFTTDYFERNKFEGMTTEEYKNSTVDPILDNIAAIFGISRTVKVKYNGINYKGQGYYGDIDKTYEETLTLTNRELFIYIQVVITKLNYQGTMGEISNLYYNLDNTNLDEVQKLKIFYRWDPSFGPLVCYVYFNNVDEINSNSYNSNIVKLFLSDKLLVESLGIKYNKFLSSNIFIAQFDDPSDIANYKYIFDPDFSNDSEEGFMYAIFG